MPIVGDSWALTLDVPVGLKKMHEKYGNLVGFNLGGLPAISISDYETITSICAKDEFCYRPPQPGFEMFRREDVIYDRNTSLVFGHGPHWQSLHNFFLRFDMNIQYN